MKIKFVYFDVGGVLIDYSQYFVTACKKYNLDNQLLKAYFLSLENDMTKGILRPEEFWKKCTEYFNIEHDQQFNFTDSWISDYKSIKPTYDFIYQIKERYKIGLITNIYHGMVEKIMKANKIPNIQYSSIIESCVIGHKKPEIDIFKIATQQSGVKPEEILFIDDFSHFLEGAKKLGWQTFLFETVNPEQSIKKLEKILL